MANSSRVSTDEPELFKGQINAPYVHIIQDRIKVNTSARLPSLRQLYSICDRYGKNTFGWRFHKVLDFFKSLRCEKCDISIKEASAGLFTFNNPIGACPECRGFGRTLGIDLTKALPDQDLSLKEV